VGFIVLSRPSGDHESMRFNFPVGSHSLFAVDLEPYRLFMTELAAQSGDFIRPFFARPGLAVETKADQTPVTLADRGAEQLMRAMIAQRFPRHGLRGEEFGDQNPDAEFTWVLDPIDGTKSFAAACPLFGTLIALLHEGQPVLGAIHQPILRQLVLGDGRTTTLNGRPVRLRPCARIEDATLLTSDPLNPARYRNGAAFAGVAQRAKLVRTWGDCYGYLLLATGWVDAMCDPIMNPWDIQALVPVIRGAGGVISDWQGGDPVRADSIVAAGIDLHPQLIAELNP
jgi:myo-inositol-1(or 4)-monophosphatase